MGIQMCRLLNYFNFFYYIFLADTKQSDRLYMAMSKCVCEAFLKRNIIKRCLP